MKKLMLSTLVLMCGTIMFAKKFKRFNTNYNW